MLTSLYFTEVLPASRPSAALKTMVMVGPSLRMRCTAMPMATTAARIGMIHTTEIRARLPGTTVACGTLGRSGPSAIVSSPFAAGMPDQAGVEGRRRDHRQHAHRREEQHPRPGLHVHQRLELHQRDGESVDEHVEHRPAADELDHVIEPRPVAGPPERAALH